MNSIVRILLMYAGEYDFKNESGEKVSGCTLNYYFFGENGESLAAKSAPSGVVGYRAAKSSAGIGVRDHISQVPGIYDAAVEMGVSSDGKMTIKVVDVTFVSPVAFVGE